MSSTTITLRHARPSDVPQILSLIHALAAYENEPATTVRATESSLQATLFPPGSSSSSSNSTETPSFAPPYARVLLAFRRGAADPDGIAIYFSSYSTWRAAPGIYLEDLFVREEVRGLGVGTALLAALARETREMGGQRLEWSVLTWNQPAIKFYYSIGAENMGLEWQVMRVSDQRLTALAEMGPDVRWE